MLIYYIDYERKKSRNGDHRYHYRQKCVSIVLSLFISLCIVTKVTSLPDSSVAMNILNDRIHVRADLRENKVQVVSINDGKILLNENRSVPKSTINDQMTMPLGSKSHTLRENVNNDQSTFSQANVNVHTCNCSTGKSTFQVSSYMQMCATKQRAKHRRKHKHFHGKLVQNHPDTEIFSIICANLLTNQTKSNSIAPKHPSELTLNMRRKADNPIPFQASANILRNNNAYGSNKQHRIHATNNLHIMGFHVDTNVVHLKNDAENDREQSDATISESTDSTVLNHGNNERGKIVKRITRSIVTKMPSKQSDIKSSIKWNAATKNANTKKMSMNGFIGSARDADSINDIDALNKTVLDPFGDNDMNYSSPELNLMLSEQFVEEWRESSTLSSIDYQTNNATCNNASGDIANCQDQNTTCVGEQQYCNYTLEEYRDMLYDYIFPSPGEWVLIGFHVVVFSVGLIGNILVCIAVYANTTMRTVTNIFIVNLAIADLLVIILCLPPSVVWDVTETWFLGESMCKVILYLQTVSVTVSVLTLTFISIDRWYAICFPLRYVSTNERAWCSIGLIWIGALLSDIPEFINSKTQKQALRFDIDLFTQCVSTWDKETEKNLYIARFVVLYLLPLFIMSIAYFKIICVLWKSDTIPGHRESCNRIHATHTRNNVGNSSTMSQLRARRKAAKMLVVVVVMFAICYLPVHCLNIMRYTFPITQNDVVAISSLLTHWLCYANSAVNPLIYNFMSGKFRREFVSVLERCRCNNREIHRHHSCYFNTPGGRMNTISPNSRSLCHFVSHRERNKSYREKNTVQTSFIENVCDIYPGSIVDGQRFSINTNGTALSRSIPNQSRINSSVD